MACSSQIYLTSTEKILEGRVLPSKIDRIPSPDLFFCYLIVISICPTWPIPHTFSPVSPPFLQTAGRQLVFSGTTLHVLLPGKEKFGS